MKNHGVACCITLSSLASIAMPGSALAHGTHTAQPIACTALASTVTGPGVKTATSAIQPASGSNAAYCKVSILYGNSAAENIIIVVALPLNSLDGGTGGVQGAWNGRTQGLGGGGCSGNLLTNAAALGAVINPGYVASGTDGGHGSTFADITCAAGLNADGTYNVTWIDDFFKVAVKQQVLFAKSVTRAYYGQKPAYNYWNGCSTGGRQGYVLAQELPKELDGILANAPAIYWTRFATAQMWGQIAIKDLTGTAGSISPAKFTYATNAAIAACDGNDGVLDGILDDPRTCSFSANTPALICTANGGASADANCLTPAEAQAIDKIWDGPRNSHGTRIWVGLDRGTNLSALSGPTPFILSPPLMQWNEKNPTFDWHTVTMFGAGGTKSYADVAQDGTTTTFTPGVSLSDETDTFGDLDAFRRNGGKLLTFVGANDQLIQPRGVLNYYRQMAARYDRGLGDDIGLKKIDFRNVQRFYRLFRGPGVSHCAGGVGPQPQNLFNTLVNWVENGVAPDQILAQGGAVAGRTRPLCPYPQTAVYNGSGSTDDAANFHCGGNLETRKTVCADVLVKYKHETSGPLDYRGTGVNPLVCGLKKLAGDDRGH
jgi:hypothetical protein